MKKALFTLLWMFIAFIIGSIVFVVFLTMAGLILEARGDSLSKPNQKRPTLVAANFVLVYGPPAVALILGIRGVLPGTESQKSASNAAIPATSSAPPIIQSPTSSTPPPRMATPPPIPQQTRPHHHEFTHQFLPDAYLGEQRARFIAALATKELEETMKAGWQALAQIHGADAVPIDDMRVSAFRHESCLCGFFLFPAAKHPGEALAALVIAGPAEKWPPLDFGKLPVRYFVLERMAGPLTIIKERIARGFVEAGFGPGGGQDLRDFIEIVFGIVFGRKRPTAQDAARRLLILKHLVVYSQATQYGKAMHAHPDFSPEAKADLHTIMGGMFSDTLRKQNLWDYVSDKEKAFFETPVQNLKPQEVLNAFWRKEAVETLMWALKLTPNLRPYDVEASETPAPNVAPEGWSEFIAGSQLRDPTEIDHAREVAELWHWRSRTRQMQEENRPFEPSEALKKAGIHTYPDVIRMTAQVAAKDGDIPACINNDFPARGKAYRDLTADEWSRVRSITIERHFTLNWLCGHAVGNDWDRTPTHT